MIENSKEHLNDDRGKVACREVPSDNTHLFSPSRPPIDKNEPLALGSFPITLYLIRYYELKNRHDVLLSSMFSREGVV